MKTHFADDETLAKITRLRAELEALREERNAFQDQCIALKNRRVVELAENKEHIRQISLCNDTIGDLRTENEALRRDVFKLACIVMDEYPEGDERFEAAYLAKALANGPEFMKKMDAAMKEST